MKELRVTFTAAPDKSYRAQLTDARGKPLGVEVPISPILTDDDYEDLRWYLEDYMDLPDGGAVTRARRVERDLDRWGRALHDALFGADENREQLEKLLAAPEPRELTIATSMPKLLHWPWELMADEAGSLAQRVSVRRQLQKPRRSKVRAAKLPLRILYIVSRPSDTGFIDPRVTAKALFDALDPLGPSVQVDFCRPPTVARMEAMLRDAERSDDPYDIAHFDGHGTFLPHAQIGALCFEKPDDGSGPSGKDLVKADLLGELLASHHVPLVVLEACRSGTVGRTAVFRSVAPRLIQAGVDSVLAMGHAVHVEAARLLLDAFYRELVRGTSIGHAVAQARKALRLTPARWIEPGPDGRTIALRDWFLPHLYQRARDDALVPAASARQQPVRQFDVFLSHNHNDAERVAALAKMLVETHGLRVWLDVWESLPGNLKEQCEVGIRDSRFTVVVGSQKAVESKWVQWEIAKHNELNPEGGRLIPLKFEPMDLPPDLDDLLWVDFTEPGRDVENAAHLARLIRSGDAADARRRRGYHSPATHRDEPGPFPPPPPYGFHGRARELYDLERLFRAHRGIVLHAMGGMGKTTLATEAAHWWTRSGLFRDGACFVSFEQFASAERVVQVLGAYLEGPNFEQRPTTEQRRRAIELFGEKNVLMVWDNFESVLPQFSGGAVDVASPYTDEERGRLSELFFDLTGGAGCGRVLVTCRPVETGLPGAASYELQGLVRADSLWLLSHVLRRDGLTLADPRLAREHLDPLLDDLADHPLSLELVGPHLRTLTPEAIRSDFGKLLSGFRQSAREGRNESLLASLEFSRRHLGAAAREGLRWLGLFQGGVFERLLLDVSGLSVESWEPILRELQGIALVRVEEEIELGGGPFLRFHPTLATAVDTALAEQSETRERFIEVYVGLMQALDQALRGSQSRTALEVLDREEANYRTAVQWAVADRWVQAAASLGDTFRVYLETSGRLRERDAWVCWLKDAVAEQGFTAQAADYERQHAWTRFAQGDPSGAVEQLRSLMDRLRGTTEFDPAFPLALAVCDLGRMLDHCGAAAQAIPILQEAIGLWEALVEHAAGRAWSELVDSPDRAIAAAQLRNLAAAMVSLAEALRSAGRHDEALGVAEQSVMILAALGDHRNAAAGHGQTASILRAAGRYDEADARYEQALAAARRAGDKELEGTSLQHQGNLAVDRNQLDRASRLYQQALRSFQAAGNHKGVMLTYNSLGVAERRAGRLAEARAWYEKSRELALQLHDQTGLAAAAQNLGIVWQEEGEAARKRGEEATARRHLETARVSVEESLRIKQVGGNQPAEALSLSQLARIHLLLGDFAAAEHHAQEALQIREQLALKEAFKDYHTLSEIARARGDAPAAAGWAEKRDALLAELERRAGGGGLPAEMLRALQALTLACAQAGFGDGTFGPDEEEALAQIEQLPAPLPAYAASLRQLAAGQEPSIPAGLPTELRELLEGLAQGIRDSGSR